MDDGPPWKKQSAPPGAPGGEGERQAERSLTAWELPESERDREAHRCPQIVTPNII